jgi:hypothetical protein
VATRGGVDPKLASPVSFADASLRELLSLEKTKQSSDLKRVPRTRGINGSWQEKSVRMLLV